MLWARSRLFQLARAAACVMPTRVINISNRLPVTVGETITKSSGGLVAALEGLRADEYELTWIGWPGGRDRGYGAAAGSGARAERETWLPAGLPERRGSGRALRRLLELEHLAAARTTCRTSCATIRHGGMTTAASNQRFRRQGARDGATRRSCLGARLPAHAHAADAARARCRS